MNSKWIILAIFILGFINFLFNGYIIFSCFIALTGLLIVLLDLNKHIIAPIMLLYVVGFKMPKLGVDFFFYYGSMAFLILIAIIDIFKKKNFNLKNPIFIIQVCYLFAIFISAIAALIICKDSSKYAFEDALRFGVWIFPTIYLINRQSNIEEDRLYISYTILAFMCFMFFQIIYYLIQNDFLREYITNGKRVNLPWSDFSTHIAIMFAICVPFITYLYLKTNKGIYLFFSLISFLMPIYLQCRGAILALMLILVLLIIAVLYYKKNEKKKLIIDLLIYVIIPLIALLIFMNYKGYLKDFLKYFQERKLDDSGRISLYKIGYANFLKHPIFGTGSHTSVYYLSSQGLRHYHNIYLQVLSCTGLFGFVIFASYVIIMIKESLNKDMFNIMFLILIMYLLAHGLVDTTFLNYRVMVFMAFLLPYLKSSSNKIKNNEI